MCVWGGGSKAKALQACLLLLRDGMVRAGIMYRLSLVRARSKRSKEDSLPQETGRAKSSRYIILLKVKRVCRLDHG